MISTVLSTLPAGIETREFERKVRTVLRGISALMQSLPMLNPLQYGLFAWQLFSHKVCRWLVPYALLGLLAANLTLLSGSPFYVVCAAAQAAVYVVAARGLRRRDRLSALPRMLTFLVLSNVSILNAWFNVLRGRQVVAWEPSNR